MSSTFPITLFAFAFTLGLVVIVHELGHFLFCKWFGVYVKTFSVGIGPKVLRRRFGETEYVLSLIPFGGYVKMAGEGVMEEIQDAGTWEERKWPLGTEQGDREAAASEQHIPYDRRFNHQPAWQRLLIFIAGPLFNLLLAFLVYAGIVLQGGFLEIPVTRIGAIVDDSPAAAAGLQVGDQILTVAGEEVVSWGDIQLRLIEPSQNSESHDQPVPVPLLIDRASEQIELSFTPALDEASRRWTLGLEPWDTAVGLVLKGGPADRMGLKSGDDILAVDGETVTSYGQIATIINAAADRQIEIRWLRDELEMVALVIPEADEVLPDSTVGRIFIERQYEHRRVNLGQAVAFGARATWRTMTATVSVFAQLFGGELGWEAVGGPLRIGQVAGEMLRWSFGHLMQFIAFFSVNLFLLNLLPIPVLDGGHVLFLALEVIRGRPVAERIQAIATQMGLIILLLFMTFIVVLDVWKVTGH